MQSNGLEVKSAVQVDSGHDVLESRHDSLNSGDVLLLERQRSRRRGRGGRCRRRRRASDGGCRLGGRRFADSSLNLLLALLRGHIGVGEGRGPGQSYSSAGLLSRVVRVARRESNAMGLRRLVLLLLRRLVWLLLRGIGAGEGNLAGGQRKRHRRFFL